jgi:cAMP phosphodiesterase
MTLNGSGVRDIARVLHVSPTTVIQELKKLRHLKGVNQKLLQQLKPEQIEVDIVRVEEPEESRVEQFQLDEMWSYVSSKKNPRWL